jgi:hypothetical protein
MGPGQDLPGQRTNNKAGGFALPLSFIGIELLAIHTQATIVGDHAYSG